MSQNESFFDEVSEEVRRDRLFAFFRRWAWLAVLVVLIAVGGAAWNEWRKARAVAEAQALGDAITAALAEPDPAAALAAIETDAEGQAVVNLLTAAVAADGEGEVTAVAVLADEGAPDAVEARWRDLATLKLVLLEAEELSPADRIARLEPLTSPGAPYRLLALEQTAYAHAEMGEADTAIGLLSDILADGEVTQGLRQRASQMIVALGGSLEPA